MDRAVTDLHATHEKTQTLCQSHERVAQDRLAIITALETELDAAKARTNALVAEVGAKDVEMEGLKRELEEARMMAASARELEDSHGKLKARVEQLEKVETDVETLRNDITSHKTHVTDLETQREHLQSRIANLETQLTNANNAITGSETRLQMMQTERTSLQTEIQRHLARITELETMHANMRASTEERIRGMEAQTQEAGRLNEEVETMKKSMTMMVEEKTAISAELEQSKTRIAELELIATEAVKLRGVVSGLEQNSRVMEEAKAKDLERVNRELEAIQVRVVEMETEKEGLKATLDEKETTITMLEGRAAELQSRAADLEKEVHTLRVAVSGHEEINRGLEGRVGEIEKLESEIQSLKTRVDILQLENEDKEETIQTLKVQAMELETRAVDAEKQIQALRGTLSEQEERNRSFEAQLADMKLMEAENHVLKTQVDTLQSEKEEREGTLNALEGRAVELENRAADLEQETEALRRKVSEHEERNRDFEAPVRDVEKLKSEVQTLQTQIDALQIEKHAVQTRADALAMEKEALLVEAEQARSKIERVQLDLDEANRIRELLAEAERKIRHLQEQRDRGRAETARFSIDLDAAMQRHRASDMKLADMSKQLEEQQATTAKYERELAAQREQLSSLESREKEVAELNKQMDTLQGIAADAVKTTELHAGKIMKLEAVKDEQQGRIRELEAQVRELGQLQTCNQELEVLSEELRMLKDQIATLRSERDEAKIALKESKASLAQAQEHIKQLQDELAQKTGERSWDLSPDPISEGSESPPALKSLTDERDALKAEVNHLRSHITALETSRRKSVSTEQRMGTRRVVPPEPSSHVPPSPNPSIDSSAPNNHATPPRSITRRDSATSTSTDWLQEATREQLVELVSKLSFQLSTAERYIKREQDAALKLKEELERERERITQKANSNGASIMQLQHLKERVERQVAEIAELAFEATKANKEAVQARMEAQEARKKCAEVEQTLYNLKRSSKSHNNRPLPTPPGSVMGSPVRGPSGVEKGTSPPASPRTEKLGWAKGVDETIAPMIDLDILPSLLFEELTRPSNDHTSIDTLTQPATEMPEIGCPQLISEGSNGHRRRCICQMRGQTDGMGRSRQWRE